MKKISVLRLFSIGMPHLLRVLNITVKFGVLVWILCWGYYFANISYSPLDVSVTAAIIVILFGVAWRSFGTDWMQYFFEAHILPSLDEEHVTARNLRHVFFWLILDLLLGSTYFGVKRSTPVDYSLKPMLPNWIYFNKDVEQ